MNSQRLTYYDGIYDGCVSSHQNIIDNDLPTILDIMLRFEIYFSNIVPFVDAFWCTCSGIYPTLNVHF